VKTFDSFTAVKGISFNVGRGEIFAFLGPNGAGKTTTIKMLTTLLRPTSGTIRLDGLDPMKQQNEARQRFGIVFQDPSLDNEQLLTRPWICTGCSTMCRAKCAGSAHRPLAEAVRALESP
jgi:ABC-type Na+ transport system ATPase subunit NatA